MPESITAVTSKPVPMNLPSARRPSDPGTVATFISAAARGAALLGGTRGIVHVASFLSMAVDILTIISMSVNMRPVRMIAQIEECCESVLDAPLSESEAETLASTLRVLADPARLRLVSFIAAQPGAEACVCNLTEPVGLSQPTVSHHLKLLNEAGVLDRTQRGRWVYYSIREGALDRVASVFTTGGGRDG
jgi:ArsR family transcriptional regulator